MCTHFTCASYELIQIALLFTITQPTSPVPRDSTTTALYTCFYRRYVFSSPSPHRVSYPYAQTRITDTTSLYVLRTIANQKSIQRHDSEGPTDGRRRRRRRRRRRVGRTSRVIRYAAQSSRVTTVCLYRENRRRAMVRCRSRNEVCGEILYEKGFIIIIFLYLRTRAYNESILL